MHSSPVEQTVSQAPQCAGSRRSEQVPLQQTPRPPSTVQLQPFCASPQTGANGPHTPQVQTPGQMTPQPPQFWLSTYAYAQTPAQQTPGIPSDSSQARPSLPASQLERRQPS